MRDHKVLLFTFCMIIYICTMHNSGLAIIPEPDNILYGLVSLNDQILSSGTVSLRIAGDLIASCAIGSDPNAANYYILRIPIEALVPISPGAAILGDQASIFINNINTPIKSIDIGNRGSILRLDLGFEDTDGDGLSDGKELYLNTDLHNPDTDGDGLSDGDEVNIHKTDPLNDDTDGDRLPDGLEVAQGLNPLENDDWLDADGDGESDLDEWLAGSDPHDASIYPGAPELCDGKDNNVNGLIDEGVADACITYYKDADNDGYGKGQDSRCLCYPDVTEQYTVTRPLDPDDENPLIPGMTLFKAFITGVGQGEEHGIIDAANMSSVCIGLDEDPSTLEAPAPPANWTVHMKVSGNLGEDIRQIGSVYEEWLLSVEISESADPYREGYYPRLIWDPNEFCPSDLTGTFQLYSMDERGKLTLVVDDMYQTNCYQTKAEEARCISSIGCWLNYSIIWSIDTFIEMDLRKGLSMVSLPVIPDSLAASDVFPGAEAIIRFDKNFGYKPVAGDEELEVGEGYWILLSEDHKYRICGNVIEEYTLTVENGWSMIGSCTSSGQAAINTGNIEVIYSFDPYFGYKPLCASDTINPANAYWILLSNIIDQAELTIGPIDSQNQNSEQPYSPDYNDLSEERINWRDTERRIRYPRQEEKDWQLLIKAIGQSEEDGLSTIQNVCTVSIGRGEKNFSFEAAPPPPQWTVWMNLLDVSESNFNYQQIRQIDGEPDVWILNVEINDDYADAELPHFYPVLSWNPDIVPINFGGTRLFRKTGKLQLIRDETGEILIDDMSKYSYYQTQGADGDSVLRYRIIFQPVSGFSRYIPFDWSIRYPKVP